MTHELLQLLVDAHLELHQMHRHYQPKCFGGCPTADIIERLKQAIDNVTEVQQ